MESYKSLLNNATRKFSGKKTITPEDAEALKKCILDIYKRVSDVCQDHGLTVMLAGGSCLGAVRHKGFIPWDDDLDLLIPRPDYDKFCALCQEGALGENYQFSFPNKSHDVHNTWMKVFRKDSKIINLGENESIYPMGVYVDIFVLEGVPKNKIVRKIKGFFADVLRIIGNTVIEAWEPVSDRTKQFYKTDPRLWRMMKMRIWFGRCFSFINHKWWMYWYDRFVCDSDMTGMVGIPTGRKLYNGEVFPVNVYLPCVEGTFEGLTVKLPGKWDLYLKNLYNDYMQIPPVEKRESHFIEEVYIPKEFYS